MDNSRIVAMDWWNKLSVDKKTSICNNHKELYCYPRHWQTLTGSEIEKLYNS